MESIGGATARARSAVQMSPNSHRIKWKSPGAWYSLGPWCFRASRSLGARSSDEFSRDSAPWSPLSFFEKLQPPHSLTLLFFLDISQEEDAGAHRNDFASQWCDGEWAPAARLCVCGAEVTAAVSYLRGCWRATRGARLLPFSSGSISSPWGGTMWLKPPSRRAAPRARFRSELSEYTVELQGKINNAVQSPQSGGASVLIWLTVPYFNAFRLSHIDKSGSSNPWVF